MILVTSRKPRNGNRAGAILILVAVALVVFMVSLIFCIDVAYMQLTRTELRSAVDASARAGAEALSRTQDVDVARLAAQTVGEANLVAGEPFTIPAADIVFGRVAINQSGLSSFVANQNPPNAVRIVSGRTSGRPDGTVGLYFKGILGKGVFEPTQSAVAAQLDRDMALVLDRSGSMGDDDKFVSLQNAVSVFMAEIDATPQTELISISVYNDTATKIIDLTSDTAAAITALSSVTPTGYTAIGLGLQMGMDSLVNDAARRPFAEPTIVLMTDGIHNTGIDPEVVIQTVPSNFVVHTITFGDGAEQQRMADLAATRNGQHFHAPDSAALIAIFQKIGATLPVVLTE